MEAYLKERSLDLAPKTLSNHDQNLSQFVDFLQAQGWETLSQVEAPQMASYQRYLELQLSPNSLSESLRILRSWLAWAYDKGHVFSDWSEFSLPQRQALKTNILSREEVTLLLEQPDLSHPRGFRDFLILESCYSLALRRSELHALSITHLNLKHQELRVMGKGSYERLLPLSPRLCQLFHDYLQRVRPSFEPDSKEIALWLSSRGGHRLNSHWIAQIITSYGQKASLTIRPHSLRYACATHLAEAGVPLRQLQKFLGHRYLESTRQYAQIGKKSLNHEYQRCHPRAQKLN